MVLGDFARVTEGKLDVLGGGWKVTGPGPVNMGIGLIVEVPWTETNVKHKLRIQLVGEDGQLVQLPGPPGQPASTLEVSSDFELGRPPGVAPGASLPFALAVNVNNVPLPPGEGTSGGWRLTTRRSRIGT